MIRLNIKISNVVRAALVDRDRRVVAHSRRASFDEMAARRLYAASDAVCKATILQIVVLPDDPHVYARVDDDDDFMAVAPADMPGADTGKPNEDLLFDVRCVVWRALMKTAFDDGEVSDDSTSKVLVDHCCNAAYVSSYSEVDGQRYVAWRRQVDSAAWIRHIFAAVVAASSDSDCLATVDASGSLQLEYEYVKPDSDDPCDDDSIVMLLCCIECKRSRC